MGADGSYFVDRNPKMFAYILDWMRGEPLDLELSPAKHRALLRDAEFYQLSGLVKALQPRVWTLAESAFTDVGVRCVAQSDMCVCACQRPTGPCRMTG